MYDNRKVQWTMTVTIFHGPAFGHAVELATETKGRPGDSTNDTVAKWQGIGIPKPVYNSIIAAIDSALAFHLISRYGVLESLTAWPDEVDPF